ncbi:MAG: hypothetical protein V4737_11585 [Curtobacterium sp.]
MTDIPNFEMRPTFPKLIAKLTDTDGLLQRLQEAVFGGMESTGGGASFGSKPPIDLAAVDLLELIGQQAAEALAAVDPRPTPLGHARDYVKAWGDLVREDDVVRVHAPALTVNKQVYRQGIEATAYRHAERWAAAVESFFAPPKNAQILAPCPKCGHDKVTKTTDGEDYLEWALVMRRDRETGETLDVYCQACTYEWPRRLLVGFADEIGIDVEGAVVRAITTDTPKRVATASR